MEPPGYVTQGELKQSCKDIFTVIADISFQHYYYAHSMFVQHATSDIILVVYVDDILLNNWE